MGLFKKPSAPVAHDDDIRREIRARVAKQVGINDEEYIKTGKISGKQPAQGSDVPAEVAPVSVATETIQKPTPKEPETNKNPNPETPSVKEIIPTEKKKEPVAKEKKPSKDKKVSKSKKSPKKQKSTVPLIIFILLLILAFIPFYYYFTGVASPGTDTVLMQEK